MSSRFDVRSVEALEQLKEAAVRFQAEGLQALRSFEHELQANESWLQECVGRWKMQVSRCESALSDAFRILTACENSGYYDPRTGASYRPDCSGQQRAVEEATAALRQAEHELSNVEQWQISLRGAATEYRDFSAQFQRTIQETLPGGHGYLERYVRALKESLGANALTGAGPISSSGVLDSGLTGGGLSTGSGGAQAMTHATAAANLGFGLSTGVRTGTAHGHGASQTPGATTGTTASAGGSGIAGPGYSSQWVELDHIDLGSSPVTGVSSFNKVLAADMVDGFQKLDDVVGSAVANGADGDYFSQLDSQQGLDYSQGYRRVYDAFFGQDAITLERVGSTYQVMNGAHRLFVAQQLGFSKVPVRIINP